MCIIQFYGFLVSGIGKSIDGILVGITLLKPIKKRVRGT
jgi:hypothetical protein